MHHEVQKLRHLGLELLRFAVCVFRCCLRHHAPRLLSCLARILGGRRMRVKVQKKRPVKTGRIFDSLYSLGIGGPSRCCELRRGWGAEISGTRRQLGLRGNASFISIHHVEGLIELRRKWEIFDCFANSAE